MTNIFYNPTGNPGTSAPGSSAPIRNEFAAISAAFDFFPTVAGNPGKALVVNSTGTLFALTAGKLSLAGDLTFLGTASTTFAAVANTTLTLPAANGTLLTTNGGTMAGILNLVNGSSIPTAVPGTNNTQIASTAFVTGAINTAGFLPLAGGNITGSFGVDGNTTLHNTTIAGTLGIAFTGVYNSGVSYAFGWDGTAIHYAINGTGKGQLYTVGQNDGRYKAIGAYTPNQVVDYLANPTFFNTYMNGNLGIQYTNFSAHWMAFGWNGRVQCWVDGASYVELRTTADYTPNQIVDNNTSPTFNVGHFNGDMFVAGVTYITNNTLGNSFRLWGDAGGRVIEYTWNGASGFKHVFDSASNYVYYNNAGTPLYWSTANGGNFYVFGSVLGNQGSDDRLKRDVEPYTRGLADLCKLKPIRFVFNGLGTTTDGDARVGLSAQATREVIPELVYETPEPPHDPYYDYKGKNLTIPGQLSLDDRPLIFAAINAIRELAEMNEALHARVKHLEERKH